MMIEKRPKSWIVACLLLIGSLPSCGSGPAGLYSLFKNSPSDSTDAETSVDGLQVIGNRESPAEIRFYLVNARPKLENFRVEVRDPATQEVVWIRAGKALSVRSDQKNNSALVKVSFPYKEIEEFANSEVIPEVPIEVYVGSPNSGQSRADATTDETLGNAKPRITRLTLPSDDAESGNIEFSIKTIDQTGSASDELRARVYYRDVSKTQEDEWSLASLNVDLISEEEDPGLAGFTKSTFKDTLEQPYTWISRADLGSEPATVMLRIQVSDGLLTSDDFLSPEFLVDNNFNSIIFTDGLGFEANTDKKRGIPLPFQVFDEDNDAVKVLFQWRLSNQTFDYDPIEKDFDRMSSGSMSDAERRIKQICLERPLLFKGIIDTSVTLGPDQVRAPELASTQAGLLGSGPIEGREITIRRPGALTVVPGGENIAGLLTSDGQIALVLRESGQGSGSWDLVELNITEANERTLVANAPGVPRRLSFDRLRQEEENCQGDDRGSVLVLTYTSEDQWSLTRVPLCDPSQRTLLIDGTTGPLQGTPLGLLALSPEVSLVTAGTSIHQISYTTTGRSISTVRSDLDGPHGLASHPTDPSQFFVSETGFTQSGQISLVDLRTRALTPLPIDSGQDPFHPQDLALGQSSDRLIVINGNTNERILQEVRLRGDGLRLGSIQKLPWTDVKISNPIPGGGIIFTGDRNLVVKGGVGQRRIIKSYDPKSQIITVDQPFSNFIAGSTWEIQDRFRSISNTKNLDATDLFVWDTKEIPTGAGDIVVRATPFDKGLPGVSRNISNTPKRVANVDFVTQQSISTSGSAEMTRAADLNGDGLTDLLTLDRGGLGLALYLQDPPGLFAPPQVLPQPGGPAQGSLVIHDMDDDGRQDIAFTTEQNITILFGDGSNGFQRSQVIGAQGFRPKWISLGDFNGNQLLDIAAVYTQRESGDDSLRVFEHNELLKGTWLSPRVFGTGPDPTVVQIGDLNHDGRLDIAVTNGFRTQGAASQVSVFSQSSSSPFDFQRSDIDLEGLRTPTSMILHDLNLDGLLDILVGHIDSKKLAILYQQNTGGAFAPPIQVGNIVRTEGLDAGDINGDALPDIVVANAFPGDINVLIQNGDGDFETFNGNPLRGEGQFTTVDVCLAHLNSDNRLDVVASNAQSSINIFFQDSLARFTPNRRSPVPDSAGGNFSLGDLDGNGLVDLVGLFASNRPLGMFLQSSAGNFTFASEQYFDVSGSPASVKTQDVNGDGRLDVCVATSRPSVDVFFQLSSGVFESSARRIPLSNHDGIRPFPFEFTAGDVDGNGLIDFATANLLTWDVSLLLQQPGGGFIESVLQIPGISEPFEPRDVLFSDVDLDGKQDVLVALSGREDFSVFGAVAIFYSGGSEGAVLLTNGALLASAIEVKDMDANGLPDIVIANGVSSRSGGSSGCPFQENTGSVTVYFQSGIPRYFQEVIVQNPGAGIEDVVAADFDGDGLIDLACVAPCSNEILIFEHSPPRSFSLTQQGPITLPILATPRRIKASDIEGDGDIDFAVISAEASITGTIIFHNSH